jgi:phosphatidylglycerophosphatase A
MSTSDGGFDRLDEWYRGTIGEPDRDLDLYLGFGLFFCGICLGIAGIAGFGIEQTMPNKPVFWLRELAFGLVALSLPALLVGVTVLLPVDRRTTYVAAAGAVVTVLAVAFFVSVYPSNWNIKGSADATIEGVLFYTAGLVPVVAATAAALVGYHVERTQDLAEATESDEATDDEEETVSDEQVRADIEEAMADADISWGGVEEVETRELHVETPDEEIDRSEFDRIGGREHRSSGNSVDDAVAGLQGLRGGQERTARSQGGVDDQAAALQELRQQQREEEEAAAGNDSEGLLARLKQLLGRG